MYLIIFKFDFYLLVVVIFEFSFQINGLLFSYIFRFCILFLIKYRYLYQFKECLLIEENLGRRKFIYKRRNDINLYIIVYIYLMFYILIIYVYVYIIEYI